VNGSKNAMDGSRHTPRALLLVGPTGSGKTPLGDLIAQRGLWDTACVHFDFGANLRFLVEQDRPDEIVAPDDLRFLRGVLRSGALLENEHFPLAERIFASFLARSGADQRTMVVMNGLPRHVGQAEAVDAIVDVVAVVHLRCSTEVILERLRTDVGGDRAGRLDDDLESVRHKLVLFFERTAPLLSRYRNAGIPIETIDVAATDTPEQVWATLDRRRPI